MSPAKAYYLAMAESAELEARSHAAAMAAAHCDPLYGPERRASNVAFYQDLSQSSRLRAERYRQHAGRASW